jgi:hypothetical protein
MTVYTYYSISFKEELLILITVKSKFVKLEGLLIYICFKEGEFCYPLIRIFIFSIDYVIQSLIYYTWK